MTSLELHRQAAAPPTWPDLLREFSTKFGHHLGERPGVPPGGVVELRGKLIAEEAVELLEAIDDGDVAAVAKEAVDLLYVTIGTMLAYGIDPMPIFAAVHAANLTKSQEKREDTKTLKGNGYLPPNITGLLRLQGWPGPVGGALSGRRCSMNDRPIVVCLCGSTRFKDAFEAAMQSETLVGKIVLTVGLFGHLEGLDMDGPTKRMLDELHLRKIDMADEVLFLNVDGYLGESSRRELAYAREVGKVVRFLESES